MSVITQLNAQPYWDDFSPEQKDFLRILFRPGYAVQARELNQLQSILQTQVERFGNHIFKDGSIVIGGLTTVDTTTTKYLKILTNFSGSEVDLDIFSGNVEIVGSTSGAKGVVVATGESPKVLIYKPLNGISFSTSENIQVNSIEVATTESSSISGNSSVASISEGIFYTKGIFVICPEQTVIIQRDSNTPSKLIGLTSEVDIITSEDDSSLLDNANGSYNYAAPGANRLKINLTLDVQDLGYISTDFIGLLEIRSGEIYKQINRPSYSEILRTLARRTYDESGDYTVKPFIANITFDATDETNVKARLSSGKAYVKGFEVETIATTDVTIPKARTTASKNNDSTFIGYGRYVIATSAAGLPDISSLVSVDLKTAGASTVGTARIRSIDYHTGTGSSTQYKVYLLDVNVTTGTFEDVVTIEQNGGGFEFTLIANTGATGVLYLPEETSLVFDVGFDAVESLSDITFDFQSYADKAVSATDTVIFSLSPSSEFQFTSARYQFAGSGVSGSTGWEDYVLITGATGPLTAAVSNVDITDTVIDITFGSNLSETVHCVAKITSTDATPNTKELFSLSYAEGFFAANSTASSVVTLPAGATKDYVGGKLKITSGPNASDTLYDISSQSTPDITLNTAVTVTTSDYFKICPDFTAGASTNGIVYVGATGLQIDDSISLNVPDATRIVKVIAKVGSNPTEDDWFDATLDVTSKFKFDNGQRDNYYDIATVTSTYASAGDTRFNIFYEYFNHTINDGFFCSDSYPSRTNPYYYTDSSGSSIDLYNAIDFRPTKTSVSTFDVPTKIAIANTSIRHDTSYYLSRIDKLAVTVDGTFVDIQGIPSISPKAPANIDDAMTLYTLYIPAYTYYPSTIIANYVENKRYTMRDIGKLEKRIEKLEYYTSLNALEQNTALFNVRDVDGLERYKNGILVDSFNGHNVGDVFNNDYHCSIDIENKELRPEFRQKAYKLSPAVLTGATQVGNLITKSFTHSSFIDQTLASRSVNVNPYSVFSWVGDLQITPSTDFWKDTKTIPTNVFNPNGEFDNIENGNNPFGSLFNQWNNMWTGTETRTVGFEVVQVPERTVPTFSFINTANFVDTTDAAAQTAWINQQVESGEITASQGKALLANVGISFNQPSGIQLRQTGTRTIPATTTSRAIRETETFVVPPPISLTTVEAGNLVTSVNLSEFIRPRTITFTATGLKPNTTVYPFFDGESISQYVTPASLQTDASGDVSGTFDIPFGKFIVGDRILLLTDSSTANRSQETTSAEARYTAQGLEQTETSLNIPVSLPNPDSPFWRGTGASTSRRPVDPLAQTFFVDPVIYPEGIFISKVDLYLKTKDSSIPLTVQIRETLNGYPSSTKVLTSKLVEAADVNTSTNASTATTVTFNNVVYLEPGEYALVLLSNSNNYESWVAQIGENKVGTSNIISEQPYVGSLFKSQNASTWTAEQTQDLTFKLYRCNFTTGSMTVEFTDWDQDDSENIATLTLLGSTGPSSTTITVEDVHYNSIQYGSLVDSIYPPYVIPSSTTVNGGNIFSNTVSISNAIGATGLDKDFFETITFRRKPEGSALSHAIMLPAATFNPFSTSAVDFAYKATPQGGSLDSSYTPVETNKTINLTTTTEVATAAESFRKRINATVSSSYVSPVINTERQFVVQVQNIINNDTTDEGVTGATGVGVVGLSSGGNAWAKYITRKITLADDSSYLKVLLTANKPSASDIHVYYKVRSSQDSDTFESKPWFKMTQETPLTGTFTSNENEFIEFVFVPNNDNTDSTSGDRRIKYDNYDNFVEYAIKIVMTSSSATDVPRIADFRSIATL